MIRAGLFLAGLVLPAAALARPLLRARQRGLKKPHVPYAARTAKLGNLAVMQRKHRFFRNPFRLYHKNNARKFSYRLIF